MKLYADILKIDEDQRLVHGYASTEAMDSQGEIVSKQAICAALPDYLKFGNIREMHQNSAVGITLDAEVDEKGLSLTAHVVDDNAWNKVKAKVYKGFSIGGRATARDPLNKKIITGLDLTEVSLVDRPANPEALIDLYKVEDGDTTDLAPRSETGRADPLAKEGRRNSASDQETIQAMHDQACQLGAVCSPGNMAQVKVETGALKKMLADLEALKKAYEDLKAQPRPAKGVLKAIGKKDGKVIATDEVHTAGKPAKILLKTDRPEIKSADRDMAFVTVSVVDTDGNICPTAQDEIKFTLDGPGTIAGVDNGDATNHESFQGHQHKVFNGLGLVVIAAGKQAGEAHLTATADGLQQAETTIAVK